MPHWAARQEGGLVPPLVVGRRLWEFSRGGQRPGRTLEKPTQGVAEGLSEDDPLRAGLHRSLWWVQLGRRCPPWRILD